MKSLYLLVIILSLIFLPDLYPLEILTIKETNDRYSGDFVKMDRKRVIFILFKQRFKFDLEHIESVNFEDSEDEFEIVLDDESVLRGSIVEEDEKFYTFGSSAGLTTIPKANIVEIRNPQFKEFYEAKVVKTTSDIRVGLIPSYTHVINDFNDSYTSYWGNEVYFEMNLLSPMWFGVDVNFLIFFPRFGDNNDFLYLIPTHLTLKYQANFTQPREQKHFLNDLFWFIKFGFGACPIIFSQKAEETSTAAIALSSALDYGIKLYLSESFALGLNGKTDIIALVSSFVLTQSAGLSVEFTF